MLRRIIIPLALIIGSAPVVYGQESSKGVERNPLLTVTAATVTSMCDRTPKALFEAGADIYVEVVQTNTSSEAQHLISGGPWRELRIKLVKDGEVIPFKKSMQEFLTPSPDKPFSASLFAFTLKPGESSPAVIDLSQWYEPLRPGHYRLTVGRMWDREYTAKPVEFDVYPVDAREAVSQGSLNMLPQSRH
ncbi:MAG TPA: hypothetical protein VF723_03280 [Pyrinomonadaceae bacterium]|jgi:hypothetical protein